MKRSFGHGLSQGRGRIAKQGLSQFRIFFCHRSSDLFRHGFGAVQDGFIALVPFNRLPGSFDRRFMNNWHVRPPLEILVANL